VHYGQSENREYRLQEKHFNEVSAEKTYDLKMEAFSFGVLMICKNKRGNLLLNLEFYVF